MSDLPLREHCDQYASTMFSLPARVGQMHFSTTVKYRGSLITSLFRVGDTELERMLESFGRPCSNGGLRSCLVYVMLRFRKVDYVRCLVTSDHELFQKQPPNCNVRIPEVRHILPQS